MGTAEKGKELFRSGVYIILFEKYGQISCWEKNMIKEDEKRGGNEYFFPNLLTVFIFFP